MHKVRSQLGYSTDQGRLLEGLTDAFYEITQVTKLHCVRHRQVYFCVVNYMYEYFDNHSEFKKKDPSVPQQFCSDGSARKSPHMAMHKFRKLT